MAVCPIPDHERKASGCGWGAGCCAGGACGGYRGPGLGCPPGLEAWGARDHSARGFSLSVRVADGHRLWPLGRSAKKEHFLLCCRGLAVRPSGGPFIRQNERTQRPVDRDLHADRRRRHDRLGAQRHPANHSVPPPGGVRRKMTNGFGRRGPKPDRRSANQHSAELVSNVVARPNAHPSVRSGF